MFQQISLVAPVANAVAIPVVSWVVTPLALVGAAFAALPEPLVEGIAAPLLATANTYFPWLALHLTALSATRVERRWSVPAPPVVLTALARTAGMAWMLGPRRVAGARARGCCVATLFVWPGERRSRGAVDHCA